MTATATETKKHETPLWGLVSDWLVDTDEDLGSLDVLVLIRMACQQGANRSGWIPRERLVKMLHSSDRSVRRSFRKLQRIGILECVVTGSRSRSPEYRINVIMATAGRVERSITAAGDSNLATDGRDHGRQRPPIIKTSSYNEKSKSEDDRTGAPSGADRDQPTSDLDAAAVELVAEAHSLNPSDAALKTRAYLDKAKTPVAKQLAFIKACLANDRGSAPPSKFECVEAGADGIELDIRELIDAAKALERDRPDGNYWFGRLTGSTGPYRLDTLEEWSTNRRHLLSPSRRTRSPWSLHPD